MPFTLEKYDTYDFDITQSSLNENQTNTLKSYAQSCYDADEQLGRLYEYIQNFDEPTILVFFGDHLPYLSDAETGTDILSNLSYFNTDNDLLNSYRKYNTQALILANFDLSEEGTAEFMSPDMLLTTIVNKMGLNLSDYYKWLYNTKETLPSTNYLVSQDINGNLYWTKNLSTTMYEMSKLREKMQYYILFDN
jgi:hypothetical protein